MILQATETGALIDSSSEQHVPTQSFRKWLIDAFIVVHR